MNGLPASNAQLFAQDAKLHIGIGQDQDKLLYRFWMKVQKRNDTECWDWLDAIKLDGYGYFNLGCRQNGQQVKVGAHRVAYWLSKGPMPEGLELDHLCRNRSCVNPNHLEPVTHRENSLRGFHPLARNVKRTHCIHGHPFDLFNTKFWHGGRYCRTCNKLIKRKARAKEEP